jgi:ethanolamine utilization protein EutM
MKTGTVIGRIVASKRLPELPAGALLEVQLDYPKDVVVCYDPMGCRHWRARDDHDRRTCGLVVRSGPPACGGRCTHPSLRSTLRHPNADALKPFPLTLSVNPFLQPFLFLTLKETLMSQAIGMIETKGYVAAFAAADAMVKAATSTSLAKKKSVAVLSPSSFSGDVGAVKAATKPVLKPQARSVKWVSCHVIPRPHADVTKAFDGK